MVDWGWDLLRSFIGAGAGTAAVTGGLALWRERGKKKAEATYLALRIAVALEAFADDCSELIAKNAEAGLPAGAQYPAWETELPAIPEYPSDTEGWKALDTKLAASCLGVRNSASNRKYAIRNAENHNKDELGHTVRREAAQVGVEAFEVAEKLRYTYDLPLPAVAYSYIDFLRKEKEMAREKDEARLRLYDLIEREVSASRQMIAARSSTE